MKQLTENEIKEMLKSAFWDRKIDIDSLYCAITNKNNNEYPIDSHLLFSRLLLSIEWYSLLKIVPRSKWESMLCDEVITKLFPKSMQKRYYYARNILLQ